MSDIFINLSDNIGSWNGLLTTYLNPSVCSAMDRLLELWDQVHMDDSFRKARMECIGEYIKKAMQTIVKEEEKMVVDLVRDISAVREQVASLRSMLRMTKFDESKFPPGSISLQHALRKDLKQLEEAKEKAICTQLQLFTQVNQLQCRIGQDVLSSSGLYDSIFGEDKLSEMRLMIAKANKLVENRIKTLRELQNESKDIYKALGTQVNISNDDLRLLQLDFTSTDVVLSTELVAECRSLNEKLKKCHDEWAEEIAAQYQDLLFKLEVLSQKCGVTLRQSYPDTFDPAKISSETVEQMQRDLGVLEDKYNRGKPIFDKLGEWMQLWKEKLTNEQRACRASFYNNRGGAIATTLNRRKQITAQLPKLLDELEAMVNAYLEEEISSEVITVDGMLPHKYAEFVMDDYMKNKEIEKAHKKNARKGCTVERGRLKKTPAKPALKKVPSTPNTVSSSALSNLSKRKRSISSSQVSAITPVNVKDVGPSTSSPKTNGNFADSGSAGMTPVKKQIVDGIFKTPSRGALGSLKDTPAKHKQLFRPWYL